MLILGIESSCDETAAAVVRDGVEILSDVVASQDDLHEAYGGVVPEIASRAHLARMTPVVEQARRAARLDLADLDAIAVTSTPGLIGALLIGVSAAKALAWALRKPLVPVHHVHAHLYASRLADCGHAYPSVNLVVSGGHTSIYFSRSETDHELLGATTDDAAGEAFDKVAQILHLGYPGGPRIDAAAKQGSPGAVAFPRTYLEKGSLDFSFSGLKTAVLYYVRGQDVRNAEARLNPRETADVAASFQEAVVEVLVAKVLDAAERRGVACVGVGGGVACNSRLRKLLAAEGERLGLRVCFPPTRLCLDNAAMVAGLGYHLLKAGRTAELDLDAKP